MVIILNRTAGRKPPAPISQNGRIRAVLGSADQRDTAARALSILDARPTEPHPPERAVFRLVLTVALGLPTRLRAVTFRIPARRSAGGFADSETETHRNLTRRSSRKPGRERLGDRQVSHVQASDNFFA